MRTAFVLLLLALFWTVPPARAAIVDTGTGDVTVDTRSDDAGLSSLTLSDGELDPAFSSATTSYAASVPNATTSITVTPTAAEANATLAVRVNGGSPDPVASGDASATLSLNVGDNPVEILVTAQDTVATRTYTVVVTRDKAEQAIDFPPISDQWATDTVTLSATGGGSSNPVTFAVTGGPAQIDGGNELRFTGGGEVTVTASQAGDAGYHAATPVPRTFTVIRAAQAIGFPDPGDRFVAERLDLSASGGGSGEAVVFEVVSGPAILEDGRLRFTGAGEVTVRATQPGDDFHDPAEPVEWTFGVVLPRPDLAVGASPSRLAGAGVHAPAVQLASLASRKARRTTGHAGIANRTALPDRRAADPVAVRGTKGNAFFQVKYLAPAGNVTAGIVSGTYRTPAIDGDDAPVALRAEVMPNKRKLAKKKGKRTVYLKKTFDALLQASSTAHPAAGDSATIRVKTR